MADDESFVILGTSPTVSMDIVSHKNISLINTSVNGESPANNHSIQSDSAKDNFSFVDVYNSLPNGKEQNKSTAHSEASQRSDVSIRQIANNSSLSSPLTTSVSAGQDGGSMAASFLMGEIHTDVLKTNVYSQLPSLCSNETNPDDIMKVQTFMSEYIELKDTLRKTNTTMMHYFTSAKKWQEDLRIMEQNYITQIKSFEELSAKLRNENIELKNELESKMDQIKISEAIMKKENQDLVSLVSEKSAQLDNMRAQIEKLEQQQLNSFEFVKQNSEDSLHADYVPVLEHKRVVKDFERQLSVLVAENLELKDMQSQYIDEINTLKVNLVSLEELCKNAQADIAILNSKDCEKADVFENYEKKLNELSQETSLLKAQLDIYRRDFEMERTSRQTLAGEKDQLLTDLKVLQRKNQQLIEEAQARLENATRNPTSSLAAKGSFKRDQRENLPTQATTSTQTKDKDETYSSANFVCPLCNISYKKLDDLQVHVQSCLEEND